MKGQDNHLNENESQSSQNNRYGYLFSTNMHGSSYGMPAVPSPRQNNRRGRGGMVVCVILCILLSFCAGAGGVFLAREYFLAQESANSTGATVPEGELVEDPDAVLDKSEPNPSVLGSAGEDVYVVSEVVRMVRDAVVVINVSAVSNTPFGQSNTATGAGSGVIVSADGYVLTCYHVVEGATSIKVTMTDGSNLDAALVGGDAASDLAMLKIDVGERELTYAKQGCSSDLVVGESVIAVGNPLGTLGGTVTTGIISATERSIRLSDGNVMTLIQTDTAINSGNSGGGLFNRSGELIGVVNAKYSASGVEGIAFAIPIDSAYPVQRDLLQYGYVRGVIDHGLTLLEVTSANLTNYYYYYGITEKGVYIVSSEYTDALANRDRLVSVNGVEVSTLSGMKAEFEKCEVGDTGTLVVTRSGEKLTVKLTLREYVPDRLKEN